MRLRIYLGGLAGWGAGVFAFGGGGWAWGILLAWLVLHHAAYRAWHRRRHAREADLLHRLLAEEEAGRAVAAHYRRERRGDAGVANPLPDLEAEFGERLLARVEPTHHLRRRHARRWLRRYARPGLPAGDVGCLAGEVSVEHMQAGSRVFLFDLDTLSLRRAAEKTGRPAVQADAAHLPVRPGTFGLVTCLEVIEHLADPARAMREIAASLSPGGVLIASTDNTGCLLPFHFLNPLIVLERAAGLFVPAVLPPRNLVKVDAATDKAYPHASFDRAQIAALVEGAGLRLLWLGSYAFLPGLHRPAARLFPGCTEEDYVRLALPAEVLLQRIPLLSRMGTHWVFACEKREGALRMP
jgi:2-polyprenyl-3-methyl-5-hydroxy-6-metoxy-1,4-benzoquinol methylase